MAATKLLSDNGVTSGITGYQLTGGDDGTLQLQTTTAGGTATTAITINNSQNVGVGTSSPAYKFDISGADNSTIMAIGNVLSRRNYFKTSAITIYDNALFTISSDSSVGSYAFENSARSLLRIENDGLFKFNSGYGSVATAYGCRAWVNFNGTGTVSIRASGNVSSITDNGTGDYTVNFSTTMPDASYVVTNSAIMSSQTDNNYQASLYRSASALSIGSCRMITRNSNVYTSLLDCDFVLASFFR